MYIGRGIDQIDNISTLDNLSFNGSDATFNLTQNSVAFVPVSADALQIQIDGVIQSGNYTVSGSTVTFDFTPSGSSVCNGIKHFGVGVLTTVSDGAVTSAKLGNNSVGITQLNVSDGSNGQALTTNGSGTLSFASVSANADNYFKTSGLSNKDLGNGLHIKNADAGGGSIDGNGDEIVIENDDHTGITMLVPNDKKGNIYFADPDSSSSGVLRYDHNNNTMQFHVNASERMRIDNAGKVFIQCTQAPSSSVSGIQLADSNSASKFGGGSGTTNQNLIVFYNGNGEVGKIHTSGSNTTYATSSDYRLKENVNYNWDATTRLKQLKPARFNFKADADTTVDGFLAHEVSSIVPQAVVGTKDATESKTNVVLNPVGDIAGEGITEAEWTQGKADGTYLANSTWHSSKDVPIYQSIDQSKLVPLLIKTIQELEARVKTLEDA